jgi:ornithine carbamoyltransferase
MIDYQPDQRRRKREKGLKDFHVSEEYMGSNQETTQYQECLPYKKNNRKFTL